MKKLSLLLILLFCWNVYSAWGYDVYVDGIYYNLDSDNHTASVTYDGQDRFSSSETRYTGDVVVPEEISVNGTKYPVTSLGHHCFRNCRDLTSITIPSSVTSLGNECFYYCSGIEYITVDANNPVYDSRENCNAIIKTSTNEMIAGCKNSHIPSSVKSLGLGCFYGCEGLTSITIPESVRRLGDQCFSLCGGLTSITIPESVSRLGDGCFYDCTGLTSITIPSSVTSLGAWCFNGCSGLTSITIPSSVTSVSWDCFVGCTGLTSITIPESVTSLEDNCFIGCTGLTSITIPSSVKSLGWYCFASCTNLEEITMLPTTVPQAGIDIFSNYYCPLNSKAVIPTP